MTQVNLLRLHKTYEGQPHPAVNDLNLEIASGKLTALLGPSGCGKTTTMKMIAGLLPATSGDITFDGASVLKIPAERRGAVMVFQNYLLFPYMSVGDNVGFGLKMRGVDRSTIASKVKAILELVRLPGMEQRRPKQLSGGQQQRVALARALVVEPKVLLLDEPLSNLDAHLRDEMRELILGIQRQLGITTIFVTHDQQEAVVLADRVALMFDGVLQQYDSPESFYERPASARVVRFFGGTNFIKGIKTRDCFETLLGSFQIIPNALTDGPALLTIRPEAVELGGQGENVIIGRIISHVYMGTHTRYRIMAGDLEFHIVAPPDATQKFSDGGEVPMKFPVEKIWLVPQE